MNAQKHADHGFTLVELVVALSLGVLLLGIISHVFLSQSRAYNAESLKSLMQRNARLSLDKVEQEALMAGYDPSGAGFAGVELDPSQLRIKADYNGDGDTDDANEDVTFSYNAAEKRIYRLSGGASKPLASNIQAFAFGYLKADGTAAGQAQAIKELKLSVTAQAEKPDPNYPQNGGFRTWTLESGVIPRNLWF